MPRHGVLGVSILGIALVVWGRYAIFEFFVISLATQAFEQLTERLHVVLWYMNLDPQSYEMVPPSGPMYKLPGPATCPRRMAQHPKMASTDGVGSIILGIWEVRVYSFIAAVQFPSCCSHRLLLLQIFPV